MNIAKLLILIILVLDDENFAAAWTFYYDNMGTDWEYAAIPPPGWVGENKCGTTMN